MESTHPRRTSEGSTIGVCLRDDTFEMGLTPVGGATRWHRADLARNRIEPMGDFPEENAGAMGSAVRKPRSAAERMAFLQGQMSARSGAIGAREGASIVKEIQELNARIPAEREALAERIVDRLDCLRLVLTDKAVDIVLRVLETAGRREGS